VNDQTTDGGVVLALVDGGTWSSAFGRSLTNLQLWDIGHDARMIREGCGYLHVEAGVGEVAHARNKLVERFLAETKAEWLLMIDTDMGFAPDLLDQLLGAADADERPMVGALCFRQKWDATIPADLGARRWRIEPTMFRYAKVEGTGEEGFAPIIDYPRGELVRVDGTGAACLLIHRSLLETVEVEMGPSWFEPLKHPSASPGSKPRWFSEDLSFCARVASVGSPLFVHTGVKTTHHREGIFLDEVTFDQERERSRPATSGSLTDAAFASQPESHWTARREDCEHPEWWHSTDAQSTEVEVTELVAAFVRALQPAVVVETGACIGQTSAAIGRALAANGHGRLVTLEPVAAFREIAAGRCTGLPVDVVPGESLPYLMVPPERRGDTSVGTVGFAWLDSLTELRIPELNALVNFGWLAPGAVIGVHDTAPQHAPLGEQLRALPWVRFLDLPTPRGVVFLQVLPIEPVAYIKGPDDE
jgi:hypothetical protein